MFNLMYEAHFKAIHQIFVEIYDCTKHKKNVKLMVQHCHP